MPWHIVKGGGCPASKPYGVIKNATGTVEGCHPSRERAQRHMAALYAAERRAAAEVEGKAENMAEATEEQLADVIELPTPSTPAPDGTFRSVLTIEGAITSDRRLFTPDSLTWRTLPIPLLWQPQTEPGHNRSVVVGKITDISRTNNEIIGSGVFDLGSDDGREAFRLVSEQFMRGVSVDVEEIDWSVLEDDDGPYRAFTSGRLMGATIVAFPAFPQAVIALGDHDIPDATSDGRPEAAAPAVMAVTDAAFDGFALLYSNDEWQAACAAREDISPDPREDFYLPHHTPDGTVSRRGVHHAASRIHETRRRNTEDARAHLLTHFRRDLRETPPPSLEASLVAAAAPTHRLPPREWFDDPQLKSHTPITITREGRIYGHAAPWDQCHIGFPDACRTAPRSRQNYAYFLTGAVEVAPIDGEELTEGCDCATVATGPITLGTGHAHEHLDPIRTKAHYDDTGTAVADVAVGEDSYGIWIAGALRPGISEHQRTALRGSSLSGDWRYIATGYELVALLAVNVPGFPIPRVAAGFVQGRPVSLVAAGLSHDEPDMTTPYTTLDPADLLADLKASKAPEPEPEPEPAE